MLDNLYSLYNTLFSNNREILFKTPIIVVSLAGWSNLVIKRNKTKWLIRPVSPEVLIGGTS